MDYNKKESLSKETLWVIYGLGGGLIWLYVVGLLERLALGLPKVSAVSLRTLMFHFSVSNLASLWFVGGNNVGVFFAWYLPTVVALSLLIGTLIILIVPFYNKDNEHFYPRLLNKGHIKSLFTKTVLLWWVITTLLCAVVVLVLSHSFNLGVLDGLSFGAVISGLLFWHQFELKEASHVPDDRIVIGHTWLNWVISKPFLTTLLISPTGHGKTSGMVISNILSFKDTLIVLSTKPDVVDATWQWRAKMGDVAILDPQGKVTKGNTNIPTELFKSWLPLDECLDFAKAEGYAAGMVEVISKSSESAQWASFAQQLISPALHAGALAGIRDMALIRQWILEPDLKTISNIFKKYQDDVNPRANTFLTQWRSTAITAPPTFAGAQTSASACFGFYATGTDKEFDFPIFDLQGFFKKTSTLYLIISTEGGDKPDQYVNPLLSRLADLAVHLGDSTPARKLKIPQLWILDEFANIATFERINAVITQMRSYNLSLLLAAQSWSQLEKKYGSEDTETIFTNAEGRIISGGISEEKLLNHFVSLAGTNEKSYIDKKEKSRMSVSQIHELKPNKFLVSLAGRSPIVCSGNQYFKIEPFKSRSNYHLSSEDLQKTVAPVVENPVPKVVKPVPKATIPAVVKPLDLSYLNSPSSVSGAIKVEKHTDLKDYIIDKNDIKVITKPNQYANKCVVCRKQVLENTGYLCVVKNLPGYKVIHKECV